MNESLKQHAMNLFLFLKTLLLCRESNLPRNTKWSRSAFVFFFDANELVVVVVVIDHGRRLK